MVNQKGKAVRMYNVNQKALDEAIQALVNLILELASEEKLSDIKGQLETHLKAES